MKDKKLAPKHRFIEPDDQNRKQDIPFSIAELKTLQGVVLDRIERDAEETNSEYFTHTELAKKLEYYITNLEIKLT